MNNSCTFLLWNDVPLTLTGDNGRAITDGFMVVGEFKRGYDVERVDMVDSFRLSSSLESALAVILVEWTDLADPELMDPVPTNCITMHKLFNGADIRFLDILKRIYRWIVELPSNSILSGSPSYICSLIS